jgi:hypothetical protein
MGKQITALWKRLSTPEEEQMQFLENHAGLGEETIVAVETYLSDKQAEFQGRLSGLIVDARKNIEGLWAYMRAGPEQRLQMFAPFFVDGPYTDELFQTHEAYSGQLTAALEDLKPILKGIEKRDELKADKEEYEAIIADPSRLLGRGNSVAYVYIQATVLCCMVIYYMLHIWMLQAPEGGAIRAARKEGTARCHEETAGTSCRMGEAKWPRLLRGRCVPPSHQG